MEARFDVFFLQILGMLAAAVCVWAMFLELRTRVWRGKREKFFLAYLPHTIVVIPLLEELIFRAPVVLFADGFAKDWWIVALCAFGFAFSRFFLCIPPIPDSAPDEVRHKAIGIRLAAFGGGLVGGVLLGWIAVDQQSLVLPALLHILFKVALLVHRTNTRRS